MFQPASTIARATVPAGITYVFVTKVGSRWIAQSPPVLKTAAPTATAAQMGHAAVILDGRVTRVT